MKTKKFISLSMMLALTAGMFIGLHPNQKSEIVLSAASGYPYDYGDEATYYNGISSTATGSDLLSALRTLNNTRKKANGGYSALLTGKKWAKYTDYDWKGTILHDTNGIPYNNTYLSFYSGNKSNGGSGMNREHVWPNSRGGSYVEDDSHMARPTLTSENSARGNSFYVEGMSSQSQGWDPGAESWGDATYRGDSARIIFYCVVASTELSLVDKNNDATSNHTMGKLSDLLSWNLRYPVHQREKNRNDGVQSIQGNRNPFIDHPEYACKIWGNYNDTTKQICGLTNISVSKSTINLTEGNTTTIYATSKDSSDITWETSNSNIATISASSSSSGSSITITAVTPGKCTVTAKATINGTTYSASCSVTVNGIPVDTLSSISLDTSKVKKEFEVGDQFTSEGLVVTANHTISGSQVVTDYTVSNPNMSTVGEKTVAVSYTENGVTKSAGYTIQVNERIIHVTGITLNKSELTLKPGETFQLEATLTPSDADNKEIVWAPLTHDIAKVSTLGKVTAKAPGTVTVTATTVDGGLVASCVVTVTESGGGGGGSSGGCGGNIATTSIVLSTLSVLGIGLLLIKRKFSK